MTIYEKFGLAEKCLFTNHSGGRQFPDQFVLYAYFYCVTPPPRGVCFKIIFSVFMSKLLQYFNVDGYIPVRDVQYGTSDYSGSGCQLAYFDLLLHFWVLRKILGSFRLICSIPVYKRF